MRSIAPMPSGSAGVGFTNRQITRNSASVKATKPQLLWSWVRLNRSINVSESVPVSTSAI